MKSGWKTGNYAKMLMKMQVINRSKVDVGIVTPKMHLRPNRSPIPMAQIYQWMEEGTSDGHVPKRPTLRVAFSEYRPLFKIFAKNLMHSTVNEANYKKPLYDIGGAFSKLVKHKIMDLKNPALSPYTIKTRVNVGTTNPLVDTGQLHDAVGFKVY